MKKERNKQQIENVLLFVVERFRQFQFFFFFYIFFSLHLK